MLRRAVVPQGKGVRPPPEAALEFRLLNVAEEIRQQHVAFRPGNALDPCREILVHVDRLSLGHRMGPDHRVRRPRQIARGHVIGEARGGVVNRSEPLQMLLHAVRQRVVRRIHIGKSGVAADLRHRVQIQGGPKRRLRIAAHIGMPDLPGDLFRVLVDVKVRDLGASRHGERRQGGRHVNIAEAPRHPHEALAIERLIAEEQCDVLYQRLMQVLDFGIRQRLGQIDAGNLGTDGWGQRMSFDRLKRHAAFSCRIVRWLPHRADRGSRSNPARRILGAHKREDTIN